MTDLPASIKAASEPQVNLLPPEVEARRARGRQRGLVVFAFIAFIVVLGLGVYWANVQNSEAQADLKAATDEGAQLQAEILTYQPVLDTEAELQAVMNARTFVGATEFDYVTVLRTIDAVLPAGVYISEMKWSQVSVNSAAPEATSLFAWLDPELGLTADLGMVSFRGSVATYVLSADIEDALNSVPGLTQARVWKIEIKDTGSVRYYEFTATARMTAVGLTGRYGSDWLEADAQKRAVEAIDDRLNQAQIAADAAEASYDVGDIDTEALEEARADLDQAQTDYDQVHALVDSVQEAREEVARQLEAAEFSDEGAEQVLADAQADLAALVSVFDPLAQAVLIWDQEADGLSVAESRVQAAEDYVAFCDARVTLSEAAVAAGEEEAEEQLASAQTWLNRAKKGLKTEQEYEAAAAEMESKTRDALEAILVQAAAVAPVVETTETIDPASEEGGEE